MNLIQKLVSLSPRYAQGEERTAIWLADFLSSNKIQYREQRFPTSVPVTQEIELLVDGVSIPAKNVGLLSGEFHSKNSLVSSLFWSDDDFYFPQNINFNPHCPVEISMPMFYQNPALAISRSHVNMILQAEVLSGRTVVSKYSFEGRNFLVGNIINPKIVIFTHYDCWESGAVDNASGMAVLLQLILQNKENADFKQDVLCVIAGNEEMSDDTPVYWGKGYRAFESEYFEVLNSANKILCVDCVGYSDHAWIQDPAQTVLAIPLQHSEKWSEKISLLTGDFMTLMQFYHSQADTPERIHPERLVEALKLLEEAILTLRSEKSEIL